MATPAGALALTQAIAASQPAETEESPRQDVALANA